MATILATGCASTYEPTPYDKSTAGVSKISMMDDALPEKPTVYMAATMGSNFGLIGALIDTSVQSSRQKKMLALLEGQEYDPETALETELTAMLAEHDYTVSVFGEEREKRKLMDVEDYPEAPEGADAILDVVSGGYGYVSAGLGSPWRPSAHFNVRLVSADTNEILMENYIAYNPLNYGGVQAKGGAITITPNPEYAFSKMEDMEANPEKTSEGIEDAITQIAETISSLLK